MKAAGFLESAFKHGGLALIVAVGAACFRAVFSTVGFTTEPWLSVCDAAVAGSLAVALVSVASRFRQPSRGKKI